MKGHFKDYRRGAGLFGKLVGRFWFGGKAADGGDDHGRARTDTDAVAQAEFEFASDETKGTEGSDGK